MTQAVKILLIEDDPDDQYAFERMLLKLRYKKEHFVFVDTLKQGLQTLTEDSVEVVVLDLSLPDSRKLEGLKEVRRLFPDLAIVVLTGLENPEIVNEALKLGAQDYLIKGKFHENMLKKTISHSIERNKLVSELRQANLELQKSEKSALTLAEAAKRANEEALIQKKQIEKKKKELEEFAYVVTHDLKAPIANLKGLLNILECKGQITADNQEIFLKLQSSLDHMNIKITDLDTVIELKQSLNLEKESVKFENILAEVKQDLEEQITTEKAEINTNFAECEEVNFPRVHLQSIFQNLIANAIKYRREDESPIINLKTTKENGYICLTVEDNGCGIDLKKYGKKLFGLFQRFHLEKEGKGIGLHIIKNTLENYESKIEVDSTVGKGTIFKVYFKAIE